MIYPYICDDCGCDAEVWKPLSECSTPETCPACSATMKRIYTATPGYVHSPAHNPGLGSNKTLKQVNAERKRQGKDELIEVGNDSMSNIKPKANSNYELSRDEHQQIEQVISNASR